MHQLPTEPLPTTQPAFNPDHVEGWSPEESPVDPDWRATFDETMALDPAVQVAGEEDQDLPVQIRERLKLIPAEVKNEVRRAHHALGHVARNSLLRLAKAAKKSDDHLFYIKHWRCAVCL